MTAPVPGSVVLDFVRAVAPDIDPTSVFSITIVPAGIEIRWDPSGLVVPEGADVIPYKVQFFPISWVPAAEETP